MIECWICQSAVTLYNYIERLVCPLHIEIPSRIQTLRYFAYVNTQLCRSLFHGRCIPKEQVTGRRLLANKVASKINACCMHYVNNLGLILVFPSVQRCRSKVSFSLLLCIISWCLPYCTCTSYRSLTNYGLQSDPSLCSFCFLFFTHDP